MESKTEKLSISGQIWHLDGFRPGRVNLEGDKIASVEYGANLPADFNLPDAYVCPGLIELQLNGGIGHDFTREPASVAPVAEALPRWGVTAFLPTFITAPLEVYREALTWLKENAANLPGAHVLGAHLEGPYLNPAFKGAHDPKFIKLPSIEEMTELLTLGGEWLRMFTLAPERAGGLQLACFLHDQGVLVAAGHSGATYEEAIPIFDSGSIDCVTHLFNALPPLHHRKPGIVGATLVHSAVTANLIVDGVHLHPAIARLVYQNKGADNIILVTDAMAGMGMPPGQYDLAGQKVIVDETSARLTDVNKTLAGSVLTMDRAIRNMAEFTGCGLAEAVQMATLNPARRLHIDDRKGMLSPGFDADLAVFSSSFTPLLTFVSGKLVFRQG